MEQLRFRGLVRRAAGRRRTAGLTLVEVAVAMAVLSFGLLAMLAMQIHALRGGRVGRHYTQASQIARNQMELFQRVPWADPQVQPTAGWVMGGNTVGSMVTTAGVAVVEQNFNVDWRVTADGADPDLRHLDVRVTWREPTDPAGMPNRRYAVSSVRFGG